MFLPLLLAVPDDYARAGQPTGSHSVRTVLAFNIPSESLSDALGAYTAATGIEVFSTNDMIAGRRSSAVKGIYNSTAALRFLLAQTGLVPHYIDKDLFTLIPAATGAPFPTLTLPRPGDPGHFGTYGAAVQQAIRQTLCGNAVTNPISYRAVLRFWISPAGFLEHPMLLKSTGDANRDTILVTLLNGMEIGTPPPVNLPQPAIILIVPQVPGSTGGCPADVSTWAQH